MSKTFRVFFFYDEGNSQSSLNAFVHTFNLKCNFLQYYGLLSAIPSEGKTVLKQEDHHERERKPERKKIWPAFSSFNPFPALPTVATKGSKLIQCSKIVFESN